MTMKKCLTCNCDISDRGNRATKCKECQRKTRHNKWNKKIGTARRTSSMYHWKTEIKSMSKCEVSYIITQCKKQLKHCTNYREKLDLITLIKIITRIYEQIPNLRGVKRIATLKCDDCKFNNKFTKDCTFKNTMDDSTIPNYGCNDYQYDSEILYKDRNDILQIIKELTQIYPQPEFMEKELREKDIHALAILPHTERINWDKAKTGWTQYYDDGLVTLNTDVFFEHLEYKKNMNELPTGGE